MRKQDQQRAGTVRRLFSLQIAIGAIACSGLAHAVPFSYSESVSGDLVSGNSLGFVSNPPVFSLGTGQNTISGQISRDDFDGFAFTVPQATMLSNVSLSFTRPSVPGTGGFPSGANYGIASGVGLPFSPATTTFVNFTTGTSPATLFSSSAPFGPGTYTIGESFHNNLEGFVDYTFSLNVVEPLEAFETSFSHPRVTCCGLGPNFSYDASLLDGAITIAVDIGLTGDEAPLEVINTWEQGIKSTWSDKYAIVDGAIQYPLRFEPRFHTGFSALIQTWDVEVHSEEPVFPSNWWNSSNWYLSLPGDGDCLNPALTGQAAAHEFGHYLGLFDEYEGATLGPFGVRTDGLMGGCLTKSVQPRYFEQILSDLESFTGRHFVLGGLPGFTPTDEFLPEGDLFQEVHESVPEPSSVSLIIASLIALAMTPSRFRLTPMPTHWLVVRRNPKTRSPNSWQSRRRQNR